MKRLQRSAAVPILILAGFGSYAQADGSNIGMVYDPYVRLLEKEIEYRTLYEDKANGKNKGQLTYRLGYGQTLTENLAAEFYLLGEHSSGSPMSVDGYEAEIKWQITQQGEYSSDWGALFEVEREQGGLWETKSTLIGLHESPNWIATGNLSLIYEWGDSIVDEWETAFSGQLRYRYKQSLEPAIEFYQSQDTRGIGPVLTGQFRIGQINKLNWEFGVIKGLKDETSDLSLKLNLEYEFY
ncbi:MAG: hypothetical protein RIB86_26190 [Imperialibacter sp.]